MSDARLTPDEDDELRLLHSLTTFGAVANSMSARYNALRRRDRRNIVRDPDETKVASPVAKKQWSDPPSQRRAEDGPMGDTREVMPKQSEKKNGIFRR